MASVSVLRFAFLAVLTITGVVISGNGVMGQGCQRDLKSLVTKCAMYLVKEGPKLFPSESCCVVVRKIGIPRVCNIIPAPVLTVVSLEKLVYVADCCGKPLAPGSRCGNYTVPPGPPPPIF